MTHKRFLTPVIWTLLLAVLLALGLQAPRVATAQEGSGQSGGAVAPIDEPAAVLADERNTIEIVERYGPSVVAISVEVEGQAVTPEDILENIPEQFREQFRQFFGQPGQSPLPPVRRGAGSGFVVDDQGRIVTNLHVVASALQDNSVEFKDNARVTVIFPGGEEELPVRVIGANPDYDLALLELIDPDAVPERVKDVVPIPLADSDEVQVGQKVVAIGNPFGLSSTVTRGIVSAVERDRPGFAGINIPFIQTDAAINPGNSGGPLINSRGELIGINNAILAGSGPGGQAGFIGVGFAVPANLLQQSLVDLEAGGISGLVGRLSDPDRPVIGVTSQLAVSDYPDSVRRSLDLPEQGAVVTSVAAGSPAAEAGLQDPQFTISARGQQFPAGADVITAVDGAPIANIRDLQRAVLEHGPGDTLQLQVWRDGETLELELTLMAASELQQNAQPEPQEQPENSTP